MHNFKDVNKVSKTISLSNQLSELLAGRKFEELSNNEQNLYNVLQAEIDYLQAKINDNLKVRREKKRKLKAAQKAYKIGLFLNKFTAEELNELATQNMLRSSSRIVAYTAVGVVFFVAAFVCALFTLIKFPIWSLLVASVPIIFIGIANAIDFNITDHIYKKLKAFAKQKEQEKIDINKVGNRVSLLNDKDKVEVVKNLYGALSNNKQYEADTLIKRMVEQNIAKGQQGFGDFEAEQTKISIPVDINQNTQLDIEDLHDDALNK